MDTTVQNFAVANLRRRPLVIETGGFVLGFDPETRSPFVNYASPLPRAEPTAAEVARLVAEFRERGLKPRVEFVPAAAPAVEQALRAAGFAAEEEYAYLVCTPATLTMPRQRAHRDSADPEAWLPQARAPHADEEYAAIDAALAEAFGSEYDASAESAARLRRIERLGGVVRYVPAPDGRCAGAGSCSAPAAGTCELAGVGTRPAFRGRGVAATVTAELTAAMFARGARSVWLESSGDDARRVYERLGYRAEGTRLYLTIQD
ncbi:GNAT family N-acetyltransferase [Actinacidiphila acidipaludis]|uniref:GNAT family N-acetyltransferase n=1 Tax=Actinacidiphila acidipaludis TaxID=2873382 RepID=A0ABS7QFH4_9ACTN|nr:GNAT family N-acetyltransferase [Streptomyces acidipaludis]MBY8881449.1 GNAT family N-acetyltransferase [Streptomyces acidipaludis]